MGIRLQAAAPAPPRASKTRIGTANVERILDAALSVFARHGYAGARLEQVAALVGPILRGVLPTM